MNKPSFDKARAALPGVAAVLAPVLAGLRGRKTYLGAGLAAALAVYYLSVGDGPRAAELLALALGLAGLRGAIARTEAPLVVLDATRDRPMPPARWAPGYAPGDPVEIDREAFLRNEAVPPTVEGFLAGQGPPLYPGFGGQVVDPAALDPRRLRPPGPRDPDRSHVRDLGRFEDDGGPPARDPDRLREGKPSRDEFRSIPEARRIAGLDQTRPVDDQA